MLGQYIDCALSLIERFQSLLSGVLALIAALIGAGALFWVSRSDRRNLVESTAKALLSELKTNEWYFNHLSNLLKDDLREMVLYDNEISEPRRIMFESNARSIGLLKKPAISQVLDFYTLLDQTESAKNRFSKAREELRELPANKPIPPDISEELDIARAGLDGAVQEGREKIKMTKQALEAALKKRF